MGGVISQSRVEEALSLCKERKRFIKQAIDARLQGVRRGKLGELTCEQLGLVNDLQCKIYKEEEKVSNKMASMQENIADDPLALIANEFYSGRVGESNDDVDRALDAHSLALATILKDADKLRLSTLKELLAILTPFQAIDYLIAAKKLHLSSFELSNGFFFLSITQPVISSENLKPKFTLPKLPI
ncbi:hypothetical protein GIB67_017350 [Kingdonia uniflora]|uniref:DOG1 domain-containing protein n=1 Tax=Kingdonia uniflora TaxID=39325 RepID=A0A7J7MPJ9_9MAGN|nr:hypothetical protein GIB67_017350 [Kingdonia uniflora]